MKRTVEQERYVDELIGKRTAVSGSKRGRPKMERIESKTSRTDYMRNCIFWIDEYFAGRTDKERLRLVLNSLQAHINTIRIETN